MRLASQLALAVTLALSAPLCAQPLGADGQKAADASNRFASDLYARLAVSEKGNFFFSPYSIETALAMTWAGARGKTAEQMAGVLHLDLPQDKMHAAFGDLIAALNKSAAIGDEKTFDLVVANRLWGQAGYPFQPAFLDSIKSKYGGGLEQVDFATSELSREQARLTINAWVAKQTQDKIQDLLAKSSLQPASRLVLTNAIYFKSKWDNKFAKEATKDDAFHLGADRTVDVPMMHKDTRMSYMAADDVAAVELPYMVHRLSMIVLLPAKVDGLAGVEKSLTAAKLDNWLKGMEQRKVELTLPKFRFDSAFGLGDTLKAMGMENAFDGAQADFSGMATVEKMAIGGVIHKAYVDVDEEGTEAAAATAVMMVGAGAPGPVEKAVFKADHPFLFIIRHNESGAILFMGRVTTPKA